MNNNFKKDTAEKFRTLSKIAGLIATTIGFIILLGWIFNIHLLKSLSPNLVAAKTNTAIALIFSGTALYLFHRESTKVIKITGLIFSIIVLIIGAMTLAEFVFTCDLGIDQLIFKEPAGAVGTFIPGRMAINTAFCFLCIGASLTTMWLVSGKVVAIIYQFASVISALISFTTIIAYFYKINEFFGYANITQMAVNTSLCILILSIGVICAEPKKGFMLLISKQGVGGHLIRRLLPAIILVPILVGWLRLQGEKGGVFSSAFGVLIVAVTYIILFILLIYNAAKSINYFDSERKQAEIERRISEEKFKNFFENSVVGKSITQKNGAVDVNKELCRMMGYSKDEFSSLKWQDLIHPDDKEEAQLIFESLISGKVENARFEKRYLHKNGNTVWCDINATLQRDEEGKPAYLMTVVNDITENKKGAEELKQSEIKFRAIFEDNAAAIAIINPDTTIAMVNDAYCRLSGYSKKEIIGMSWTKQIPPEDLERLKEYNRRRLIDPTNAPDKYEFMFIHKNGEIRNALISISLVDKDKNIIASFLDITDQVASGREIIKLNRLYELIGQINEMIVRTSDKNTLFSEACRIAVEHGKFKMAWIGLVDFNEQKVKPAAWCGYEEGYLKNINISILDVPEGRGPTGKSVREKRFIFNKDISADPEMAPWKEEALKRGYHSSISLPIIINNIAIGAFTFYASEIEFFNDSEIKLLEDVTGDIAFAIVSIENESKRREIEKQQLLTVKILSILNRPNEWRTLINDIMLTVKQHAGIDAVAIRIKKEGDFPFFAKIGFTSNFFDDNYLLLKDENGEIVSNEKGESLYNCLCGVVISGRANLSLPFFTPHGSFYSNNASRDFVSDAIKELNINIFCPGCSGEYESIALIPIYARNEILGLMQLADKRKNILSKEIIEHYEKMSATIGIAFVRMYQEKQIKEREAQFRALFENASLGIYRTTPEGKTLIANPALVDMLGYPSLQVFIENNAACTSYLYNKDREKFREIIDEEGIVSAFESQWKKEDGTIIYVSESAHVVSAESGKIVYYEGFVEDITRKKKIEKDLISEKEKADRLKSEFLAQMSHEIRSPMNATLSFAELLKAELSDKLTENQIEYLDGIEISGKRLIRTVDLILNYSEMQVGLYEPSWEDISLIPEVIDPVIKHYTAEAKIKGLEFSFVSKINNPVVYCDKYSINEIMFNLVDNAIKYTPKGKVEIIVDYGESEYISISVKDTGIGISEEFMDKLFQPFMQEDRGYSRTYEGNGIGLSLVKKYCDLNNAEIKVVSEKNKGSKFTIIFKNTKI